jgi:hypothetical protein
MARKSLRPKGPIPEPVQRGSRLLATLGRPGPEELDAVLEGVQGEEVLAAASHIGAMELALIAMGVYSTAHETTGSCTRDQRMKLRGCSLPLIALGLDQALALHNMTRELSERTRVQDVAKQGLAQRTADVEMQCGQARALLVKVAPSDVAKSFAELPPPGGPSQELESIATVARRLLQEAPAAVLVRARLYGVDREFIDGLAQLAEELRECEKAAHRAVFTDEQWATLRRAHVATWTLVNHFLDAFVLAHKLDKQIPPLPFTLQRPGSSDGRSQPESTRRLELLRRPVPSPLEIPRVGS